MVIVRALTLGLEVALLGSKAVGRPVLGEVAGFALRFF
jgi:hypothetical protein